MSLCICIHIFLDIGNRDYRFVKLPFINRILTRIQPDCTLALQFSRLKAQTLIDRCSKLHFTVLLVCSRAVDANPIKNVCKRRWLLGFGSERIIDKTEVYSFLAWCGWLLRGLMRLSPIGPYFGRRHVYGIRRGACVLRHVLPRPPRSIILLRAFGG
jgi:hypothetical protein